MERGVFSLEFSICVHMMMTRLIVCSMIRLIGGLSPSSVANSWRIYTLHASDIVML